MYKEYVFTGEIFELEGNIEDPEDYLTKRAERILNMDPKNMGYPERKKD